MIELDRKKVAALVLSAAGLVGLAISEGYTSKAIIPVPGDVPTLGFGTTDGVKLGDSTTPPKALERTLRDVQAFESALKKCVSVPLTQYEYDTYVELAYNIGGVSFCSSTLVSKLNALDYEGACKEILRWNRAKGRVVDGLTARREREYKKCIGE